MNIQCTCGIKYNKKEFKQHFRNCKLFLEKYKDFDFKISTIISKYFKYRKTESIIIFLLERYIKLIKHKINKNKLNIKRNLSENNLNKDNAEPLYKINKENSIDNNNNSNLNIQNFNLLSKLNYKTNNDFNKENKNLDESLMRNNCIIRKKKITEFFPNTSSFNNYNKFRALQKKNEINFEIFQQSNISKTFIENPFYNYSKNFGIINNPLENQQFNSNNISWNLKYVGSQINNQVCKIIIDSCKTKFMENKGVINYQTINYLISYFKYMFHGEWFIIISNIEYQEIYYNFTSFISDKSIIFHLNTKIFCVICYNYF